MRSDGARSTIGLRIGAVAGLLFLHLPLALIFLYAFTTEEKSYAFPPPDYTLKWFAVAWERQDIWNAMALSLQVGITRRSPRSSWEHSPLRRWPERASSGVRRSRC